MPEGECEVCGILVEEIEKRVCEVFKDRIPVEVCKELMDMKASDDIDYKVFVIKLAKYGVKEDEFNEVLDRVIDEVIKEATTKVLKEEEKKK